MPNYTMTISPTEAITRGAKFHISGTPGWIASGTATSLSAGTYTVSFRPAEGYTTPADVTVTIAAVDVSGTVTYATAKWSSTWDPPLTVCFFRGQVFTGGIVPTNTASYPDSARLVRWSEIGSMAFLGATANPIKNEAGFWYLPGAAQECVMAIKALRTCVIVYGRYSTWKLTPVKEPAPTYSIELLMPVGINYPAAVDGTEEEHCVVTRTNGIYMVSYGPYGNVQTKSLGFKDYIAALQTGTAYTTRVGHVKVVYNRDEDEYYISNTTASYILHKGSLTETDKIVNSVIPIAKADLLFTAAYTSPLAYYSSISGDTDYLSFTTDIIDFNLSAIKTIQVIEIQGTLGTSHFTEVAVDYRYNRGASFTTSTYKRCSPSGIVFPIVSGVDFRIRVRSTPQVGSEIESMTIGWKLSDKTSVRGVYNNASNAST